MVLILPFAVLALLFIARGVQLSLSSLAIYSHFQLYTTFKIWAEHGDRSQLILHTRKVFKGELRMFYPTQYLGIKKSRAFGTQKY